MTRSTCLSPLFFFNDTATTEIYTLSLHDALPIYSAVKAEISILSKYDFEHESNPLRHPGFNNDRNFLLRPRTKNERSDRSEEHTSELQSPDHLVCRLLLEKKKQHYIPRLSSTHIT